MDNNGYIRLYRSLLDWEWWSDDNTLKVFLYFLLNANWKESKFRGYDVPVGGLVIGINSLSESLNISVQSVRTAINHLKTTNEITIKSTNKFSIVTITNWDKFQGCEEKSTNKTTSKLTNDQQTTNKQLTTEEEYKNIKKNNNIFIRPTLEEVRAYCEERNNSVDPETFINFYESKGWYVGKTKMRDWKAAVRTWEKNRNYKPKTETKNYDTDYDFDELERQYGLK